LLKAFPVLGILPALTAAPSGPPLGSVDPHVQRSLVFAALREFLYRLAERRPLILLIDDLQWTDADSLALLSSVMSPPDEPPLLLVATLRQGAQVLRGTWLDAEQASPGVQYLQIGKLPMADALQMAQQLTDPSTATKAERLQLMVLEAEGHPLFIRELLRQALHRGQEASLRLDDALFSRIKDLPEPTLRLLQLCAVMGSPLSTDVAAHASAIESEEVERSLMRLRAENLLRAAVHRREGDSEVRELRAVEPYHDRIREVVVVHLSVEQRRQCHKQLAEALETLGRSDPEALAFHYSRADLPKKAGQYALQAAKNAEQALAFERAAQFYQQVLELETVTGEARQSYLQRRAACLANGNYGAEAAKEFLQAAQGADAPTARNLQRQAAEQYLRSGHTEEGVAVLRNVLSALGIRFPKSERQTLFWLLLRRVQLGLRGGRFTIRPDASISELDRERIETCWMASQTLGSTDLFISTLFSTQAALMALRHGHAEYIAYGVTREALNGAIGGGSDLARGHASLERARQLGKTLHRPTLDAFQYFIEG